MLKKVEVFEHDEIHASGNRLGQMKIDLKTLEAKLDALVDLYLNHNIEREIYLSKKDALMRQKSSLQAKSSSVRAERKNWVEPLRKWILDSKRAGFLATSENLHEMRDFLRSFGTNPALKDKTISISFCPPSDFARAREGVFLFHPPPPRLRREPIFLSRQRKFLFVGRGRLELPSLAAHAPKACVSTISPPARLSDVRNQKSGHTSDIRNPTSDI